MRRVFVVITAIFTFMGCDRMKVEDFSDASPQLALEDYFDGRAKAWGIFEDRFGNIRRQFTVDISGDWNPATRTLVLVEDFEYDDGETERRVWTLNKIGDHRYEGSADGVVGTAKGEIAGNAFNWEYTFDLPVGGSTLRVNFDDWMFLQPDDVIVNRAVVTKWGFEIGRATIMFRRLSDASENATASPIEGSVAAE